MSSFWKKISDNWQDSISLILGLWLILSPWALAYTGIDAALWNAVAFGALIAIMAVMALVAFHEWEEWTDMAIGLWLIVSPWVLGFAMTEGGADPAMATGADASAAATWTMIVIGVLTLGLAAWSLRDHRTHAHG